MVAFDDLPDQPGIERLFGGEALAHAEQRKGALMAHDARREQAGGRFRHQRKVGEGRAEQRARRRECHVAMQMDRRADADRQPVDARDDGFRRRRQRDQEFPDIVAMVATHGDREEVLQIVAGGKRAGRAEEDMHAHRVVRLAFPERLCHRVIHGAGYGVLLVRPVQPDHLHRFGALDENMIGHRGSPQATRNSPASCRLSAPVSTVRHSAAVSPARFSAKYRQSAARSPSSASAKAALAR